jgi:DNA-binding MarR family transcriptional regulator
MAKNSVIRADDPLRLVNQLCFPLYAASREVTRRYAPLLSPLGLSYTQYITMMVLWEKRSITVKQLGETLFLDSGTLTPLLKRLEAKGLIKRERSTDDERSLVVSITKQGSALKKKCSGIPAKIGACFSLKPAEAGALYKTLYKIMAQGE